MKIALSLAVLSGLFVAPSVLPPTAPAAVVAVPDQEMAPFAYLSTGGFGDVYFKMLPGPNGSYDRSKGSGAAYKVKAEGPDELLWKTSGWYGFTTFLSADGKSLVRVETWPRGNAPSKDHLAIEFFHEGKSIRKYSTAELVENAEKITPTVSHYVYLAQGDSYGWVAPFDTHFRLKTIDDIEYVFDVTTGEWKSKKKRIG